jgi:hypothetical protein
MGSPVEGLRKAARDILISHVGDVDIENEYFPPFAMSYASDHREGGAEGQGWE